MLSAIPVMQSAQRFACYEIVAANGSFKTGMALENPDGSGVIARIDTSWFLSTSGTQLIYFGVTDSPASVYIKSAEETPVNLTGGGAAQCKIYSMYGESVPDHFMNWQTSSDFGGFQEQQRLNPRKWTRCHIRPGQAFFFRGEAINESYQGTMFWEEFKL